MSDKDQALYLGRWVSTKNFRTWIYNASGKKLVESWLQYEHEIGTGEWFATQDFGDKQPVNIRSGRKAKNASADS